MPGIPHGRGCDTCRRHKKRCDQAQPVCGRCVRLKHKCSGGGQQRYKFITQVADPETLESRPLQMQAGYASNPTQTLSNKLTLTTGALVSALNVIDLRFDLSYFGDFLKQIPQRLGNNAALDASTVAVVNLLPPFFLKRGIPLDALSAYGNALKTLRVTLNDPALAKTPDTLCAIYLIILCQQWLREEQEMAGDHLGGLSTLLHSVDLKEWTNPFDLQLLLTMCRPLVYESLFNDRVNVDFGFLAEYETAQTKLGAPKPDPSLDFKTLSLPKLLEASRMLRSIDQNIPQLRAAYAELREELPRLRALMDKLVDSASIGSTDSDGGVEGGGRSSIPHATLRALTHCQGTYGLMNTFALILNHILRVFSGPPTSAPHVTLEAESTVMCCDVIALARAAADFRPLGASYAPLCLAAVWAVATSPAVQDESMQLLNEYENDYPGSVWKDQALYFRQTLGSVERKRVAMEAPSKLSGVISLSSMWEPGMLRALMAPPLTPKQHSDDESASDTSDGEASFAAGKAGAFINFSLSGAK